MSNYYSEDPNIENELIDLFGIPDKVYEEAMKKCLTIDYDKATTEELWNIVKHLEPEGYFDGRKTREFFVKFIEWQRMRNKDAGYFYQEEAAEAINVPNKKEERGNR